MLNIIPMDLDLDEVAISRPKIYLTIRKSSINPYIFPSSQGSNNYVVQKNIISIPFQKESFPNISYSFSLPMYKDMKTDV
jgi:hypothetical protein